MCKNKPAIVILLIVFLGNLCPDAFGKDFKVLYVSAKDAVTVDGYAVKVGDIISETSNLVWRDEGQVIKVTDLESFKQFIICAKSVEGKKSYCMADYFLLTKTLSSRDGDYNSLQELSSFFQGLIPVDGQLVVRTNVPQDKRHFFYLTCQFDGYREGVNKALAPHPGELILPVESIFQVDGQPVDVRVIEVSLHYYDTLKETSVCVSPSFLLVPVP